MPGYLVDQAATIACLHQGRCTAPTTARMRLSGSPVLLRTSLLTVAGCALPPPPGANGPDVSGQWTGAALRVRCDGVPVILADSPAVCLASGLGVIVQRTQIRVKGK